MSKPATSLLAFFVLLLALLQCVQAVAQLPGGLLDDELPPLQLPTPDEGDDITGGGAAPQDTPLIPDSGLPPLPGQEPVPDIPQFEPSDGTTDGDDGTVEATDLLPDSYPGPGEAEVYYDEVPHDAFLTKYLTPVYSSGDWLNCCRWYGHLEFILMHRTVGRGTELGEDRSVDTRPDLPGFQFRPIVTDNVGFRIEPGARVTVGRYLGRDSYNRDASVEVSFLGGFDWETGIELASLLPQQIFTELDPTGGGIGGFNRADEQRFIYTSDLRSIEANVRLRHRLGRDRMVAMPDGTWSRQLAAGLAPSYYVGLRYLTTREDLIWTSRREGVDPGRFGGDYDVETHNNLVGMHIGGDFRWQSKSLYAGIRGKGGGFINFGDIRRTIRSSDPLAEIPATGVRLLNVDEIRRDEVAAVILEAGFYAAYQLNPHIAIRTSYDMLWMNGLAVAQEQITFEPSRARIDLGGNVFYQGLTTGIEIVW